MADTLYEGNYITKDQYEKFTSKSYNPITLSTNLAKLIYSGFKTDRENDFSGYKSAIGYDPNNTSISRVDITSEDDFIKAFNDEYMYKLKTVKFATGGYTGDNVPASGALAVLDNKELVLNEDDTANMLKMIYTVRDMQNKVSTNTNSSSILDGLNIDGIIKQIMQTTVQSFTAAAASISNFNISKEPQDINQNVSISANFPNVQNHNEIELAIQNLTSIAAQKAFSTRK